LNFGACMHAQISVTTDLFQAALCIMTTFFRCQGWLLYTGLIVPYFPELAKLAFAQMWFFSHKTCKTCKTCKSLQKLVKTCKNLWKLSKSCKTYSSCQCLRKTQGHNFACLNHISTYFRFILKNKNNILWKPFINVLLKG